MLPMQIGPTAGFWLYVLRSIRQPHRRQQLLLLFATEAPNRRNCARTASPGAKRRSHAQRVTSLQAPRKDGKDEPQPIVRIAETYHLDAARHRCRQISDEPQSDAGWITREIISLRTLPSSLVMNSCTGELDHPYWAEVPHNHSMPTS